MAAIGLAL